MVEMPGWHHLMHAASRSQQVKSKTAVAAWDLS